MKWKNLIENQTGKKIKVLQYDHVEEYKNSFLQFGQNNGIETHFTDEKDSVAKEVNHAYWRRFDICCLMHHWTNSFGLRRLSMLIIS